MSLRSGHQDDDDTPTWPGAALSLALLSAARHAWPALVRGRSSDAQGKGKDLALLGSVLGERLYGSGAHLFDQR